MRLAICNETFGAMPLGDALRLAADAGYTGWEVAPFMLTGDDPVAIGSISPRTRREYRTRVEDAGLQIVGLHWLLAKTEGFHLTTIDAAVRHRTADYLSHLGELCRDLGGDTMVLGSPGQRNYPPGQTRESATDHAADVLSRVAPGLEALGVVLALEPLGRGEGNFWNTAGEAVEMVRRIDSPSVRLHLDVKAMSDEPTPIPDIIRSHAADLWHFHANDPNLRGPGMGDVDFGPILTALDDVGYDRWISVEVFDYEPGVESIVRDSADHLRRTEKSDV